MQKSIIRVYKCYLKPRKSKKALLKPLTNGYSSYNRGNSAFSICREVANLLI